MNAVVTSRPNRAPVDRVLSRRKAFGIGGALAAAALTTPALARQATPSTEEQGATPERVAAALEQIDSLVAELLEQSGAPGLAIAVVYRDEIVHLTGYGVREAGGSDPIDADTVFQLASVSKPLAATTIAAAVGDRIASWDDRVNDLLPAFELYDPWVTREVTVRDLFAHRSGLPDHAGDDLEDLGYSREEVLHRLRYVRLEGAFRASYAYTNFGLSAAAFGVAAAAGLEWEELAEQRLYQPLGMSNTSSRFDDYISAANRAIPHVRIDGTFGPRYQRQPDAQTPAGGVSSSVRDLAQWLRLLLGGGTLDGEEIIEAAALGEMFRPHSPTSPAANPLVDRTGFYGLGWNVSADPRGRLRFNHSGGFSLGASTNVAIVPAEEIGVAVLTNVQPIGLAESLALSVLDLAIDGAIAFDYFGIVGPFIEADVAPKYGREVDYTAPPAAQIPPRPLDLYAGTFVSDVYGNAVVTIDGAELVIHLGPDQTPFPLRHYSGDLFLYQPVGENAAGESAVIFTFGVTGRAERLTIEILNLYHEGEFVRSDAAD